jgi:hypothetical protein
VPRTYFPDKVRLAQQLEMPQGFILRLPLSDEAAKDKTSVSQWLSRTRDPLNLHDAICKAVKTTRWKLGGSWEEVEVGYGHRDLHTSGKADVTKKAFEGAASIAMSCHMHLLTGFLSASLKILGSEQFVCCGNAWLKFVTSNIGDFSVKL